MRAVEIVGPGVMRAGFRALPALRHGELLVHVAAAGVNRHDLGQVKRGQAPEGARSEIPGLEVAGEVVAGSSAEFPVGTRVAALVDGGGYAEYCAADAGLCLPIPADIDELHAAAMPEALLTVCYAVIDLGRLQPGGTLLVIGAAGGVGIAAIQTALLLGCKAIAVAGSAEKRAALAELGAIVSGYDEEGLASTVAHATDGRGADAVLDLSGADRVAGNLRLVSEGGSIVHMSSGDLPAVSLPLRALMVKSASITGGLVRPLPLARKREMMKAVAAELWPHIGTVLKPRIDSVYPLEEAIDAHRRIESRAAIGKVVLRVGEPK